MGKRKRHGEATDGVERNVRTTHVKDEPALDQALQEILPCTVNPYADQRRTGYRNTEDGADQTRRRDDPKDAAGTRAADPPKTVLDRKHVKKEEGETASRPVTALISPTAISSTPGDYISDEERAYFRAIRDDLNRIVSDSANALVSDTEEEYMMVWDRLESRETALCQDKELSFIVENLLRLTGSSGAIRLMSILARTSKEQPDLMGKLCTHFSASHVIETVLDSIASFSSSDRDATKRFSKAVKKFITALLARPSLFLENSFAAHVAQKLLLRLCRVKSFSMDNDGMNYEIMDAANGRTVTLRFGKDEATSRKFTEAVRNSGLSVTSGVMGTVLMSFQEMLAPDTNPDGLSEWLSKVCQTEAASLVVQALVAVTSILQTTLEIAPDSLWIWRRPDQDSSAPCYLESLTKSFNSLIFDKCGSRVAEVVVGACTAEVFDSVLLRLYGENSTLEKIIRDQYAHHSLVKSILFATEVTQLVTITQALKDHFAVIVQTGHGMILVKLAQKLGDENAKKSACGRHGGASEWNGCQTAFVESLRKVYDAATPQSWTDVQKKDNFVVLTGALYPKNFRPTMPDTAKNLCMAGSQVLQAMCAFKDSASIANSTLKMDKDALFELCNCAPGSYLMEVVLDSNRNRKSFYHPFVKKLSELAPQLIFSRSGSRMFDYLWKTVDLKHREEIAEALLNLESKMKTHDSARYLLPKLNLGLFRRSVDAWRNEQQKFQNQKDDLKNILDLINKTK